MDTKFRKLRADEIDVRVGSINKGGVSLLLYKDARCDMNILDETVGPLRWQRHHSRENANCVVAIFDDELKEWIEKEDTGTESNTEKEKGLASDSFKRACVNWGIGRELYTAPDIFISKDRLKGFKEEGDKRKCYDSFSVKEITYDEDAIKDVTIEVSYYGTVHGTYTFSNSKDSAPVPAAPVLKTVTKAPAPKAEAVKTTGPLTDDEVILIGNCKGKKYGDVKDSPAFASFLNWVKTNNTSYNSEAQQAQYTRLKAM